MESESSVFSLLQWAEVTFASLATCILLWFLIRRPPLERLTKLWLLFGIGVFPIGAAMSGNVVGYEATQKQQFCGSCHVMVPYLQDATSPDGSSLAAMHARNRKYGRESCYICHADYQLFGAVTTKLNGLRHLWAYFTKYRKGEPDAKIQLYHPYLNENCTQCHSGKLVGFQEEPEHAAVEEDLRNGTISCASKGCHGPAHKTIDSLGPDSPEVQP